MASSSSKFLSSIPAQCPAMKFYEFTMSKEMYRISPNSFYKKR
jgi:hypothetical protein